MSRGQYLTVSAAAKVLGFPEWRIRGMLEADINGFGLKPSDVRFVTERLVRRWIHVCLDGYQRTEANGRLLSTHRIPLKVVRKAVPKRRRLKPLYSRRRSCPPPIRESERNRPTPAASGGLEKTCIDIDASHNYETLQIHPDERKMMRDLETRRS